jgi:hypothetical protein
MSAANDRLFLFSHPQQDHPPTAENPAMQNIVNYRIPGYIV